MFRLLAANWLTSRLSRPMARYIPNPYLRAAALAATGVLVTRAVQRRSVRA